MNILVTGGSGYIGSHTLIELIAKDHRVVVVDNLSNSSSESIRRVEKITGQKIVFYNVDLRDQNGLNKIFKDQDISAVIHFAGLKAVGESVEKPLLYYRNNLESTLSLLSSMDAYGVKKLVFSSSATVYGDPQKLPVSESHSHGATNPYGQTKQMIEQILKDVSASRQGWSITSLRYFNPIGAHESGLIGEDPDGPPNNLLPFVAQVAAGKRSIVKVFGDDYDTPDGTGVRDYIHVIDLARAHIAALDNLKKENEYKAYNVGTGKADSVLEMISAFESVSGKKVPFEIVGRRPGDIASCYADVSLIEKELGWKAELSIEDGCRSMWNWQQKNPNGYAK